MNTLSQFKANGMARKVGAAALLIALTSAPMFAQDPFTSAAQGFEITTMNVIRILAGIVTAILGISMVWDHQHGMMGRFIGAGVGLIVALFAVPIVTYIQSL